MIDPIFTTGLAAGFAIGMFVLIPVIIYYYYLDKIEKKLIDRLSRYAETLNLDE